MKETKTYKYNVIWIDDKYEEIDLCGNAEQDNIFIQPFKYGKDGIKELKAHIDEWDGVIVDVKCLWASDDEVDRVESFHKIKEELLSLRNKRPVPYFVYSGQPDILSDDSFRKSLNGHQLYKKNLDEEKLLKDVKLEADMLPEVIIRHKYLDVIGPFEMDKDLYTVLLTIYNGTTDDSDVFPIMRKILNWLMYRLKEYGILALDFNGTNLNACSNFLCRKELENYIPSYIQRSIHSTVTICNNGSHLIEAGKEEINEKVNIAVSNGDAPFLIRSTAFELMNIIVWYKHLPQDETTKNEIKKVSKSITIDNPSYIEGILLRDDKNRCYYCEDCYITNSKVLELKLKLYDQIRITKFTKNINEKMPYNRFAQVIEKI